MANYSWNKTSVDLPVPENGTIFSDTIFTRKEPHTPIFTGVTGLVFRDCNLTNCDLPEDAIVEGGIHCHISFCSHEHPKWIDKGLTQCVANCSHVTSVDTITIDGVVVDTIYHHSDKEIS